MHLLGMVAGLICGYSTISFEILPVSGGCGADIVERCGMIARVLKQPPTTLLQWSHNARKVLPGPGTSARAAAGAAPRRGRRARLFVWLPKGVPAPGFTGSFDGNSCFCFVHLYNLQLHLTSPIVYASASIVSTPCHNPPVPLLHRLGPSRVPPAPAPGRKTRRGPPDPPEACALTASDAVVPVELADLGAQVDPHPLSLSLSLG